MITVFYDGKCGLCSKEINYYKTIANPKKFTWLDVANNPNHLKSIDVTLSDALMQLHVLDNENNISIMESGAIMLYLAEKYKKFLPTTFDERFKCIEWLNFQTASQGPMLGQAHHFLKFNKGWEFNFKNFKRHF